MSTADLSRPAPRAARRRTRATAIGAAILLAVALVTASALWATNRTTRATGPAGAAAPTGTVRSVAKPAVPLPTATLAGLTAGKVAWQQPLTLSVTDGALAGVVATDPAGTALEGAVGPDGLWRSSAAVRPDASYRLVPTASDANGDSHELAVVVATTTPSARTMTASLIPGDGAAVGVGQPVIVRLNAPVKTKAARAAVERAMHVTTTPAVDGSWHWMSDGELHYRPAALWAPGTKVSVASDLTGIQVGPDTWGNGQRTASFTIGDAFTSVADVAAHTMTVSRNGAVVRVMPASMGRPQFPTRNGTFIVLEKFATEVMDSATVNLPPGTAPYKTTVKDAVRITNSGTFTHGAPWSVPSQGRANVSHGCINLSPTDAHWYYTSVARGDVVTVINSNTGPVLSDAGSSDWNMSFALWQQGSALV